MIRKKKKEKSLVYWHSLEKKGGRIKLRTTRRNNDTQAQREKKKKGDITASKVLPSLFNSLLSSLNMAAIDIYKNGPEISLDGCTLEQEQAANREKQQKKKNIYIYIIQYQKAQTQKKKMEVKEKMRRWWYSGVNTGWSTKQRVIVSLETTVKDLDTAKKKKDRKRERGKWVSKSNVVCIQ